MIGSPIQTQWLSLEWLWFSLWRKHRNNCSGKCWADILSPASPSHPKPFQFFCMCLEQGEAIVFMRLMLGMTACVHDSLKSQSCFANYFLKIKLRRGTSDEEVVSVFSATVSWILFQEAVSPLSCILTWATPLLHVLVASQKETELILKWARCLADTVIVSCGSRGTKRDIAGSQNLEQQFIYMK